MENADIPVGSWSKVEALSDLQELIENILLYMYFAGKSDWLHREIATRCEPIELALRTELCVDPEVRLETLNRHFRVGPGTLFYLNNFLTWLGNNGVNGNSVAMVRIANTVSPEILEAAKEAHIKALWGH